MSAKGKILLVDDDVEFVNSTTDLLEAHGYTVISAPDGMSGLELARKERPDLMVLDVMMATKTEGFDVARKIPGLPELHTMPVLLVTGIRKEMALSFRLEPDETWLPVSRIMEKPVDPADVRGQRRRTAEKAARDGLPGRRHRGHRGRPAGRQGLRAVDDRADRHRPGRGGDDGQVPRRRAAGRGAGQAGGHLHRARLRRAS